MKYCIALLLILIASHAFAQLPSELQPCNIDSVNGMPVYRIADEEPVFEGGTRNFFKVLKQNLSIPNTPRGWECDKIYLAIVLDTTGNIHKMCATRCLDITPELIGKMNKWSPAKHEGKAVHFKLFIPMYIRLD